MITQRMKQSLLRPKAQLEIKVLNHSLKKSLECNPWTNQNKAIQEILVARRLYYKCIGNSNSVKIIKLLKYTSGFLFSLAYPKECTV